MLKEATLEQSFAFAFWLSANGFQLVESFYDEKHFGNELLVYKAKDILMRVTTDRGDIYIEVSSISSPDEWFALNHLFELLGYKEEFFYADQVSPMRGFVNALNKDYPRLKRLLDPSFLTETQKKINELERAKEERFIKEKP